MISILTQDKGNILQPLNISISEDVGSIVVETASCRGAEHYGIGRYETEERAKEVLLDIFAAMQEEKPTFTMPQE